MLSAMPVYDFTCPKCKKDFTKFLTLKEYEKGVKCPKCGNKKVEQKPATFFAVTSRKS